MSIVVPKVKVSSSKKREKIDLGFDSGTTTNFGFVQPSMCREMIPNSKFEVSVNSRVLNAPMPVPTYGRINLLHKHVFVPYVDVCPQFQSFISGQSYKPSAGDAYIPSVLPYMDIVTISQYVLSHYADWSIYVKFTKDYDPGDNPNPFVDLGFVDYEYRPVVINATEPSSTEINAANIALQMVWFPQDFMPSEDEGEENQKADPVLNDGYFYGRVLTGSQWNSMEGDLAKLLPSGVLLSGRGNRNSADVRAYGNLLLGGWQYLGDPVSFLDNAHDFEIFDYDDNPTGKLIGDSSNSFVSLQGADYISKFGIVNGLDIVVAFKLRPAAKRFRSILLGLGYQFVPNLYGKVDNPNWLKLFAFYKSWFNCYRPKRELSFTNTYCYDLIKLCELSNATTIMYADVTPVEGSPHLDNLICNFIADCCYTSYYLPQDYFGMSVTKPNINYANEGQSSLLPVGTRALNDSGNFVGTEQNISFGNNNPTVQIVSGNTSNMPSNLSPLALKVGQLALKYVNKNTIAGRSIIDYYRVHFGINLAPSHDNEEVFEIGDIRIPIDINIVQSQAGTDTDELGSYAAFGIGYNKQGNKFVYENGAKDGDFGVWLTLTTVVPKSGYNQGILRENDNLKRFDFFTGEFDAAGYDIVKRSEISADYPIQVLEFNQPTDSDFDLKKGFGFNPRYSYYKVSRNILSGELSLRGYAPQFGAYSLDRKIPYEQTLPYYIYDSSEEKYYQYNRLSKPNFVPTVVFDNFRRIDFSDRLGNYNRIFYSESTLDDHFIITSTFKVDAWLPAMSLSESFDTISDDSGKVIDITHS